LPVAASIGVTVAMIGKQGPPCEPYSETITSS
jgi:hypothetical protein